MIMLRSRARGERLSVRDIRQHYRTDRASTHLSPPPSSHTINTVTGQPTPRSPTSQRFLTGPIARRPPQLRLPALLARAAAAATGSRNSTSTSGTMTRGILFSDVDGTLVHYADTTDKLGRIEGASPDGRGHTFVTVGPRPGQNGLRCSPSYLPFRPFFEQPREPPAPPPPYFSSPLASNSSHHPSRRRTRASRTPSSSCRPPRQECRCGQDRPLVCQDGTAGAPPSTQMSLYLNCTERGQRCRLREIYDPCFI